MTICYLVDYDLNSNSGVVQKILQQSSFWSKSGYDFYLVSTKTLAIYDKNKDEIFKIKPFDINFGRLSTALRVLYNSFFLIKLLDYIKFDILYMRYMLYTPWLASILKKYTVVMEINSDDILEYKLHSKITYAYNMLTRNFILKKVDGFVTVSRELKIKFDCFKKPIEVIANGVDVSRYKVLLNKNEKPILVFIGTPDQAWHGLDKIITIAENLKNCKFYIIGIDGKNTSNIKYFGYLNSEESTKIIQQCDIGIGTLSLYKKGLNEASPLKTRQYLACGLPVIYAYVDTDLDDSSISLRLNNNENNINHDSIKNFVDRVFNDYNVKKRARKFAEEKLDFSIKEKKRLEFFERVVNAK
ncbi:MAG: glycosyltransferase [Bacteroidota bacterium]|nr:glycosyltransferase [Bacteroidota bacterium]